MKKEFIKYLESIDITKTLGKRIETIYGFYREICPDEITDIFISDYIKDDGSREYESACFFSKRYCMEAKQFVAKDNFDITPIQKRVVYWTIQKQDYDFEKATEKSRLHLDVKFDTEIRGEFKAAKQNCDYLRDIIVKHVMANLKE